MTPADLKQWRDRLMLSNREAADMLGLTPQAFLDQIYGHRPVSPRTDRLTRVIEGLVRDNRDNQPTEK